MTNNPDKYQVIRIAIAVDHYNNYLQTKDMKYLDLYATVKAGLTNEGIEFNAYEIVQLLNNNKEATK